MSSHSGLTRTPHSVGGQTSTTDSSSSLSHISKGFCCSITSSSSLPVGCIPPLLEVITAPATFMTPNCLLKSSPKLSEQQSPSCFVLFDDSIGLPRTSTQCADHSLHIQFLRHIFDLLNCVLQKVSLPFHRQPEELQVHFIFKTLSESAQGVFIRLIEKLLDVHG